MTKHDVITRPMTLAEFLSIAPYPEQVRTEKHAKKLAHSMKTTPVTRTARIVWIAHITIGRAPTLTYVLDANTRQHVWRTGMVEPPAGMLVANHFYFDNWADANAEFARFNSIEETRTTSDLLAGHVKNRHFVSSRLKNGAGLSTAAPILLCATDGPQTGPKLHGIPKLNRRLPLNEVKSILDDWLDEMDMVDPYLTIGNSFVPAGIVAAALLHVRKHGERGLLFWSAYKKNDPDLAQTHPVAVLRTIIKTATKKVAGLDGYGRAGALCAKALACAENYLTGTRQKNPQALAIDSYLRGPRPMRKREIAGTEFFVADEF